MNIVDMLKMLFPVLDKEDRHNVILLLYKYREKLKLKEEELITLSKLKPNKFIDAELIKNIITTELGKYTDEQLKTSFIALQRYVEKSDIELAMQLHIMPDRIKKMWEEVKNAR